MLIVTDGAPGLVGAIEELWPEAERQRCAVHRLRNVLGKLPKRQELHDRVQAAYWRALDQATSATDGEARLRQVVGELEREYRLPPPAWPRTCRALRAPRLPPAAAQTAAEHQPPGALPR